MLLYDITSDRIRNKVAITCADYGLDRTQYSAFIGELSRNHQEELMLKCTSLLGDEPGSLLLMPVDWARRFECRNAAEAVADNATNAADAPAKTRRTADPNGPHDPNDPHEALPF